MNYDADWARQRLKQALEDPSDEDLKAIRRLLDNMAVLAVRHDHDKCGTCK